MFDTARSVIVAEIDGRKVVSRTRIELQNGPLHARVGALAAGGVDVLLCGAVSRPLYEMLETAGIEVTPFLSGPVEVLLQAFMEDRITDPLFSMPGCCRRRRRHRGKGRIQTMKEGETT